MARPPMVPVRLNAGSAPNTTPTANPLPTDGSSAKRSARHPPASNNAIATVCAAVPPKPAPWPAARARTKTAAASTPARAPPKRRASQKTNSTVAPANTAATSGATGTNSARPRPPDPPA